MLKVFVYFVNGAYRWWSMRDVSSEFIGLLCFVHFSLILQPFWFEHQIMNISKTRLRLTVAGCRWRCNWSWLSSIRISGCRRTWGRVSSYGSAAQPFNPRWDDWRAIGGCHLDCNLKGHHQTNNKQIIRSCSMRWELKEHLETLMIHCSFTEGVYYFRKCMFGLGALKDCCGKNGVRWYFWKFHRMTYSHLFPAPFPRWILSMDWGEWSGVEQLCEATSHGREICMLDAGV